MKRANQVSLVMLDSKDYPVKRVTEECLEEEAKTVWMDFLETMAFQAWMACQACMETKETLDCQEELDHLDLVEMLANKVPGDNQDLEATTELKEIRVLHLAHKEKLDYRVLMVLMAQLENLVLMAM